MSNKKLTLYAMVAIIVMQLLTIVSGFIIPKIVLTYFGSEVNGLISSISQLLSYIQLLEGGVNSVAMSVLYKSLADKDYERTNSIIKAIDIFFKKIGIIYIGFVTVVAIVYPIVVSTSYNYLYVSTLIIVIAAGMFVQYFFALTYRVLINADRRGYIVSIAQCVFIIANLIFALVVARFFRSIHFLKLGTVIAYLIQPIIFSVYVKKNYPINIKHAVPDNNALKQKWDGFGHNLAYFIHANTDIIVLTALTNLVMVSIYAVYASIANALKTLLISISASIKPSFGNVLVSSSDEHTNEVFDFYEIGMSYITTVLFSCCMVLIVPFVSVYTSNISDTNYYQPLFAFLLCLGEFVYCLRDPYISAVYTAGHFKQTAKFAYAEALMNILISIVLVKRFGIVGVAVGTLIAMIFRMIAHIFYLKKEILRRSLSKSIKNIVIASLSMCISVLATQQIFEFNVQTYLQWFVLGVMCFGTVLVITSIIYFVANIKLSRRFFVYYIKRR